MTYELKGGEEIRDGVLYGWTGQKCSACDGHGMRLIAGFDNEHACPDCGGTGELWGVMPEQPDGLETRDDILLAMTGNGPKTMRYIGPLRDLRDLAKRTALVLPNGEGSCLAQFDGNEDWRLPDEFKLRHPETGALLCVGWHAFPAAHFEPIPVD